MNEVSLTLDNLKLDPAKNYVVQYKRYLLNIIESKECTFQDIFDLDGNTPDLNQNEAIKAIKAFCKTCEYLETNAQAALNKFNLSSWDEVNQKPEDFKLIKRVQFNEDPNDYPKELAPLVGDEINVVFLDFETTGLSHQTDKVIELGLVKLKYSRSKKLIREISLVRSEYDDPGMPIPSEITKITGISDADVKGKKINIDDVKQWIGNDDAYIIAHNSKFDRPFFGQLMGEDNYRWGCSASQVDWKSIEDYRIESAKLEYILLKLGYFYEGHRASIDCLAMVQMFYVLPNALEQLLVNIDQDSFIIEAPNSFSIKDQLKEAGYRWNGDKKTWWIEVPELELDTYLNELDQFSPTYNSSQATQIKLTAKERFK